ncbi:MAG: CotH kinase family protein [Prevotella sp.]|nr:CotH kinase family protein [Prevotella sp.]
MRIKLVLFVLFFSTNIIAKIQLTVNGVEPAYDSMTDTYLLSVDKNVLNSTMQATIKITHPSAVGSMMIDNVTTDGMYVFQEIGGNKKYYIETTVNGEEHHCYLQFTALPVISINGGNIGYDYSETNVLLQENGTVSERMKAKIKWRGGSTNVPGKHKRNYKLKMLDSSGDKKDYNFFGLRKDNNWILDAGQVDMFRMRNLIVSQIWQDFAHKPYYIKEEPKALTATRGQMVEVFVDNCYQGIYNMCEPIDRKQMKLKKFEEDGTIHGGLWKATSFGDATFWNVPAEYDNTKEKNDVWELKYPEIDDLCPSDYSTLWNAIMFVATSSDEEFNQYVADYFDIPVLIDYYLFVNITNNFDICGKNIYWAVYDKEMDQKLTPAMWDLDCSMGQFYTDEPPRPDDVAYDNPPLTPNKIFYRLIKFNTDNFNEKVRNRYIELRKSYFATSNLQKRFSDAYDMILQSGASFREQQRWSYDSDIAGLPLNFEEELAYITNWIDSRMIFLDKFFHTTSLGKHIIKRSNQKESSYDLRGFINGNGHHIFIKNRKKYINK